MSTPDVSVRARASLGGSSPAIYRMVARALFSRRDAGADVGVLVDVGCGSGELHAYIASGVREYVGVDVLRYDGFPANARFVAVDLDSGRTPLPDASADVVTAVETIEHLENPRAFLRDLVRLARPGGLVLVSTPNQLSLLSLITLLVKRQFNAFQDGPGQYPSHLTALLESDLERMARECGLVKIALSYSHDGRMPFTSRHWPAALGLGGRRFSDNVLLVAETPQRGVTSQVPV